MDRDENAARNILSRGLGTVGHTGTFALDAFPRLGIHKHSFTHWTAFSFTRRVGEASRREARTSEDIVGCRGSIKQGTVSFLSTFTSLGDETSTLVGENLLEQVMS
jgi:hypothetical protein